MDLKVSIFESRAERSPTDFFITDLNSVTMDTTLSKVFYLCWNKQSNVNFNWTASHVVAICRGVRHEDLSKSLNQLLHQDAKSVTGSKTSLSVQFVARNRHRSSANSQQLVEQTLRSLHSAALLPGGLLALCKAASQLDAADVPGLGEDRRAQEIITDHRLQGVMLKRPRLLQQLVRRHPVLASAIATVVKRVQQNAQSARLPTSAPGAASAVAGNMPPGANYNVDFESVLDEDEDNDGEGEDGAAAAAMPTPSPMQRGSRSRPTSSSASGGASGGSAGQVSSDFLRQAMAQAFTLIPARQRFANQLRALREMGITDEEAALRVLEQNNGDLELTIDHMFN
ncbi:hypothetical protein BOX15_Mlig033312g3 [Macrostomum lignano]|uniref:UBA domain-containing protein n=2 Tax=Macrostomum lignano TaxID=282301 RepID=A0A1I8H2K1_9PLAT|nr:hypothetical protein BOX15_Mlig033312g3 [Macrostomum lignano]